MNSKDNPPRLPRRPDDCSNAEWDDWLRVWHEWTDHHFGPFTPVGGPGW